MRWSALVVAVVLAAASMSGTGLAQEKPAPSAKPAVVDYDTFMKLDTQGRIRTFNEVTPENRAALVQTQIKRWRDKNQSRLSPEQLKMIEENLAFVTADRYRQPMTEAERTRAKDLEMRTAALFSREEMMQMLTISGEYIVKK